MAIKKLKELINEFNKTKNIEIYDKIIKDHLSDIKYCKMCSRHIIYYDTKFRINRTTKQLSIYGKTFLTKKKHGEHLNVCEKCIIEKFPEYQNLNKGRIFNTLNEITLFAFDIKDTLKYKTGVTKENLIRKYGLINGTDRWDSYRKKQAYSNTYECKKEKYNWSRAEFRKFNKNRSSTKENFIKRHGLVEGQKLWNTYVKRQKYTTSKKYFMEKYGKDFGLQKFENFCEDRMFSIGYSKISQDFFNLINEKYKYYNTYYAIKNHEWFISTDTNVFYLDYYIKDLKIAIEFNGDIWHANPNLFKECDKPNPFNDLTAKEIREIDKYKRRVVESQDIKIIYVWEYDINKHGIETMVKKTIKEIENITKQKQNNGILL